MLSLDNRTLFALIAVTAVATYLLRVVPLVLLRRPLRNPYLVALLEYMPYALLSAMIFPDVLYATGGAFPGPPSIPSVVGGVIALILSFFGLSLPLVACVATLATYLASVLI